MQISKILITNNTDGNHPADKWAMVSAEMIADSSELGDEKLLEANRLQLKFADILVKHHDQVQQDERVHLAAAPQNILTKLEDSLKVVVDDVVAEIVKAAEGTLWAAHYASTEVQNAVGHIVKSHFLSSQHVERLCHADRNPNCEHAQAYKAAQFGGAN